MSTKKFVSAALTATTSVWLSGAMLLVPVAHAQDVASLQAQIATLLAQIAALQAQLGTATSGGAAMSYAFSKDLTLGSVGPDVKALQQFLNSHGAQVAASGAGSPGNESEYFGSLTKAALAKWQAANGITPSVGYFGPKTRATINPMMAGGTGTVPGVVAPASGLAVSLAADSATGSAIAGAGQVKVGKFNFTAGVAGGVTVSGLEFQKVGVLSDSNVSNLYLADAMTGEVVAQYQSLTNGVATFSGLALNVAAGQTWVGELRMDLSSSATAGNTIAWKLSNVMTASGATVTGMPQTNSLTVTSVSNPSIATLTLTETIPNATTVTLDAGTSGALVSSWTAAVGNSAVNLTNMQFQFVGSANPADVKNLKLKVNGVEVATLPQAAATTNFNFVANPVKVSTGNATIELYADIMGSPNRTFRLSLLQPYRVGAVDTQYNTGITPSITNGTGNISINTGSITLSLDTSSPTGPLPQGASNQTVAKFRIYAAGEPVKVKFLTAKLTANAGSDWNGTLGNYTEDLTNIKLVDDAGGQVGNTISAITAGTTNGTCALGTPTLECYFGTSASPVNYIVPANTSRVLSLVVDISSNNDLTSLKGEMVAPGSANLEGQISYQSATSGASAGAVRQVTLNPLSLVVNSGFSAPTYAAGANGVKIASFVISAASAEGAKISSLTFDKDSNSSFDIQNLKVMVGSTQFGVTRATIGDAETSLPFSASTPVVVPAGGSVTVDVYADILTTSGAATHSAVIDLIGWLALGATSNSSITFGTAVSGQDVTIASGPVLTVAKASESAPTKQVVMGSTGNSLFTLRLTADNVEDVRVTEIALEDVIGSNSAGKASYENVALYDGTTLVSGPKSLSLADTSSSTVRFTMTGDGVIVPKNGTKNLELKGDVASYTSGGAYSGSTHNFRLQDNATSSVVAYGKDSSAAVTVSGTPNSNTSTVYRTKVTLSSALMGASAGRSRQAVDDIAYLNFAANSSYQAILNTVTLKFSGGAVASGTATFDVYLIDANTNAGLGSATAAQSCDESAGTGCTVTFNPVFTIDAGSTKQAKVRVDSSNFTNGASVTDSLSVVVNAVGDVMVSDGSVTTIPLETTVVPFSVVTVSYE